MTELVGALAFFIVVWVLLGILAWVVGSLALVYITYFSDVDFFESDDYEVGTIYKVVTAPFFFGVALFIIWGMPNLGERNLTKVADED